MTMPEMILEVLREEKTALTSARLLSLLHWYFPHEEFSLCQMIHAILPLQQAGKIIIIEDCSDDLDDDYDDFSVAAVSSATIALRELGVV